MQKKYELRFISDPGHGWLEVPLALLKDLGIDRNITPYSYLNNGLAYLEEDCDYGTFVSTARDWIDFHVTEEHQDNTPIRGYAPYPSDYKFTNDPDMVRRVFG